MLNEFVKSILAFFRTCDINYASRMPIFYQSEKFCQHLKHRACIYYICGYNSIYSFHVQYRIPCFFLAPVNYFDLGFSFLSSVSMQLQGDIFIDKIKYWLLIVCKYNFGCFCEFNQCETSDSCSTTQFNYGLPTNRIWSLYSEIPGHLNSTFPNTETFHSRNKICLFSAFKDMVLVKH